MTGQAKTCSESYRRIENLKSLGDSAECAGPSGPGDSVRRKWCGVRGAIVDLRSFAFAQDKFWICDGSTSLTTGFGFWIDGAKHMNETFQSRFLDSQSDNRKLDVLGEDESIFEGALDGQGARVSDFPTV